MKDTFPSKKPHEAAELLYISHLHCDHFDPKTLGKYKNKNTKIIIKKFKSKRLKNKIKNLGFKNIIEQKVS